MTNTVFIPAEKIIFTNVEEERQRLLNYCRQLRCSILVLDLTGIVQCDSAGLAFLIEAKRLAYHYKKSYRLHGKPKAIYALAQFCGIDSILTSD